MALGTIIGALAAGAASAAGAKAASSLFGGSKSAGTSGPMATGFSAGGLTGTYDRKTKGYNVTSDPSRDALVGEISNTFARQAGELGALRQRVAPGMSDLRAARLTQIENARSKAIGDLRENLQRRRVLGSSFGADALSRAESEFGQAKAQSEAESLMQELGLTAGFLQQEMDASRSEFSTKLGEMNLQAEIATALTGKATAALSNATKLEMELAAKSAAGAGQFFGQLAQPAFKAIGSGVGSWVDSAFSGGGSWAPTITYGG